MRTKARRVYQNKMWEAARFYRSESKKCYRARAYFSATVAHAAELEAVLRIFDFVENPRLKDRCHEFCWPIKRAFARHWISHDALRYWKQTERYPLKIYLHEVRQARNGVHAHLFNKRAVTAESALTASLSSILMRDA